MHYVRARRAGLLRHQPDIYKRCLASTDFLVPKLSGTSTLDLGVDLFRDDGRATAHVD
jgi:hypothetical protein